MAKKRGSRLSSSFDEMLKANWRQFEALTNGVGGREREAATPPREGEIVVPSPSPRPAAPPAAPAPSDAVRFLNDRYGDGWSYEIAERRREGDEVIVLCKLSIPGQDISKSQFGRATVIGTDAAPGSGGSADGITFSLGSENGGDGDPEEAAFQRALNSALAKCADML